MVNDSEKRTQFNNIFWGLYGIYHEHHTAKRIQAESDKYYEQLKGYTLKTIEKVLLDISYSAPKKFPLPGEIRRMCHNILFPENEQAGAINYAETQTPGALSARREFWKTLVEAAEKKHEETKRWKGLGTFGHPIVGLHQELILMPLNKQRGYEEKEKTRARSIERSENIDDV